MKSSLETNQLNVDKGRAKKRASNREWNPKSSRPLEAQTCHYVDTDRPILPEPLVCTETVVFPIAYQQTSSEFLEPEFSVKYDQLINHHLPMCADAMMKKGKLKSDQWEDPSFIKAVLYEYSHPFDKRGNKKAKKLGNKAIRRALEAVKITENEATSLLQEHREKIQNVIEEISNKGFEESLKQSVEELPIEQQGPLMMAIYRPDIRSYLPSDIQHQYHHINKSLTEYYRGYYGSASDHQFDIDTDKFELSLEYDYKNAVIQVLEEMDIPDESKNLALGLYYGHGKSSKQSPVQKILDQVISQVEKKVYTNYLGDGYRNILLNVMRDHLYFYDRYCDTVKGYYPPLSSEEVGELTDYLQGNRRAVSDKLKTLHKCCYAQAYEDLLSNDPSLCISWKLHPGTMNKALQLKEEVHTALLELKCDESVIAESMACLSDRHLANTSSKYHLAQKHLENVMDRAWQQVEGKCDTRLLKIKELNDNICFMDEFRRLYGPVSGVQLLQWFKNKKSMPKNAQQVMRIVLKKVKLQRGLPINWKPATSLLVKVTDHFDSVFDYKQKACEHLIECLSANKTLSSTGQLAVNTDDLLSFVKITKEALYTSIGFSMFPSDKTLNNAVISEELTMRDIVKNINITEMTSKPSTGLEIASVMSICYPSSYWLGEILTKTNDSRSIVNFIEQTLPKGLGKEVSGTITNVVLSASAGLSLNVTSHNALNYVTDSIKSLTVAYKFDHSLQNLLMLTAVYLVFSSAYVQAVARLLLKTGAFLSSAHVESVLINNNIVKTVEPKLGGGDIKCTEDTVNNCSLKSLVMSSIEEHQDLIVRGAAAIYNVPKETISMACKNYSISIDELIDDGSLYENLKRRIQKLHEELSNNVITNNQQFDNIGTSLTQMILSLYAANVENYDIKFDELPEHKLFRLATSAIAETALGFAIQRERFLPNDSLTEELDKTILKNAGGIK